MTDKKTKKHEPVVDYGITFGGLLKGLGDFMEIVSQAVEEGDKEVHKTGEISFDRAKSLRGMYGVTMRVNRKGIPQMEKFGMSPESDIREPVVDVFDEDDLIRIIAEVPGVEEGDVILELKEDLLVLRAERDDRKYEKEIRIPSPVKGIDKTTYRTGLVEIELRKE